MAHFGAWNELQAKVVFSNKKAECIALILSPLVNLISS